MIASTEKKMSPCNYTACLLGHKLLKHPSTISPSLHSFCRKCIYKKLFEDGVTGCALCNTNIDCNSVDKLRPEHDLHDLTGSMFTNIFPLKRKAEASEVSSSSEIEDRLRSFLVNIPIISMQVDPTLTPDTEEVATKGEVVSIYQHKSLALKRRRSEEILEGPMRLADYQSCWNLSAEGGRSLLNMACQLVHSAVPPELSKELMKKPLPDTFQWMKYLFDQFFANNCTPSTVRFEDTELQKLVGEEDAGVKQCGEFEQKVSNLRFVDHDAKIKEQADFYEAKLTEQAEHHEAKVKFLENELTEKWKELSQQNKRLEQLNEVIKQKDEAIEILSQRAEDCSTRIKETAAMLEEVRGHIIALEEQANGIPKLHEDSRRAGMEEGVKRLVRAVQAASPYVNWDQIHVSEDTTDEDREALQRAFADGISTAASPVTQGEHQGHIIFL